MNIFPVQTRLSMDVGVKHRTVRRLKNIPWFITVTFLLSTTSCRQSLTVEKVEEVKTYASGSGLAYSNKSLFVIGDDMSYLLVTDTSFQARDSIRLTDSASGRMAKDVKLDFESIALLRIRKAPWLLLLGSGSLEPYRTKGLLLDLRTRERRLLDLKPFYDRLQASGIKDQNIEGGAATPGGIILANRGNKSSPKNYLVFTSYDFWDYQTAADIRVIKLGVNTDTASFSGVSGLEYSFKSDCLLLTVSTENTYSNKADGAIGKSYLWLINNISAKRRMTAVNPDQVIDLEKLDSRFRGHKIESVCIVSENKSEYRLILVADDDKGTTVLFKVLLQKKKS